MDIHSLLLFSLKPKKKNKKTYRFWTQQNDMHLTLLMMERQNGHEIIWAIVFVDSAE